MTTTQALPRPPIDSLQFLDGATKKVIKAWIEREPVRPTAWTPLAKPLSEAKVALISSAAVALKSDQPFDQEGERRNPWWGDPSYRVIPRGTNTGDIRLYHLHVDTSLGERDLDCVLPLTRLEELAETGEIGAVAPSHYSFMGYILDEEELLRDTVPEIIARLKSEAVDAVILVPV
jgi:hypothetical protein